MSVFRALIRRAKQQLIANDACDPTNGRTQIKTKLARDTSGGSLSAFRVIYCVRKCPCARPFVCVCARVRACVRLRPLARVDTPASDARHAISGGSCNAAAAAINAATESVKLFSRPPLTSSLARLAAAQRLPVRVGRPKRVGGAVCVGDKLIAFGAACVCFATRPTQNTCPFALRRRPTSDGGGGKCGNGQTQAFTLRYVNVNVT